MPSVTPLRGVARFLETLTGTYQKDRIRRDRIADDERKQRMDLGTQTLRQYMEEKSPQYQAKLKESTALTEHRGAQTDLLGAQTDAIPIDAETDRTTANTAATTADTKAAQDLRRQEIYDKNETDRLSKESSELRKARHIEEWNDFKRKFSDQLDPLAIFQAANADVLESNSFKTWESSNRATLNKLRDRKYGLDEGADDGGASPWGLGADKPGAPDLAAPAPPPDAFEGLGTEQPQLIYSKPGSEAVEGLDESAPRSTRALSSSELTSRGGAPIGAVGADELGVEDESASDIQAFKEELANENPPVPAVDIANHVKAIQAYGAKHGITSFVAARMAMEGEMTEQSSGQQRDIFSGPGSR
jgi:hypothetical protein